MGVLRHYNKLKEARLKSQTLWDGVLKFKVDSVRLINGKTATREYIVHPGASAVMPVIGNKIVMVCQYRYPVKSATWEIPAGKLKPGQTPLSCAKAELAEETGYRAKKIKKLITFFPCCAFSDEVLHIFIAEGLTKGEASPDGDEFLNVKLFALKEAFKMVKNGQIKDAKTIIALSLGRIYSKI
jgi:ADP-ribose pyrophosphatase